MEYTKIKNWLKENLSEDRYYHSLGTADCAKDLAYKFGEDAEKAYLAGLVHDCAKCFSKEKLRKIIEEKLDVDECEMLNYKTFHAPVSAYIIQNQFDITDKDIISAVRWHTLGKLDMTNFEKIIFISDKIEPNTRCKEYCENIRNALKTDNNLDNALLICYKETLKSLIKRDLKICLKTVEIYNQLLEKNG